MTERFFDTNVLACIASGDVRKADLAETLLRAGGVTSVQVPNELANVARRKMRHDWDRTLALLSDIRVCLRIVPVTVETHERGLLYARPHMLPTYDAMIAASGVLAGCAVILSEDFQHGFVFAGQMRVENPFLSAA